jgi:preprotein translocase subunit SecG
MRLFILLFYLLITILMIAIILFQKSESGLGLGGGSMGGMVTTRGVANLMTRATGVLATIFMVLSLALAYLSRREVEQGKLITRSAAALEKSALEKPVEADGVAQEKQVAAKPTEAKEAEAAQMTEGAKGASSEAPVKAAPTQAAPSTTPAPSAPAVPVTPAPSGGAVPAAS